MQNTPTIRKIDYFGGTHGHFLELLINHSIDGNPYDITTQQFTELGTCHVKHLKNSNSYKPITQAQHFSFYNLPIGNDDLVIRITPRQKDMLIVLTNSFCRAGDQELDLKNLEYNTRDKLASLPKLDNFLNMLTVRHGHSDFYNRAILRHYFESMFNTREYGLDMFLKWNPANTVHEFEFGSLFYIEDLFESLQKIAKFVNLKFTPSLEMVNLHQEFLDKNQGWQSQLKCSKIIESIIKKQVVPMDLNIIEEAWVSYRIAQLFNCYNLLCCQQENFPSTTLEIIQDIDKGLMC